MRDGDLPLEPAGNSAELTPESLAALFEQAKQAWLAANFDGVTAEKLDALTLEVEDFGSNALATYKDGVITIDDDAAGAGWFVRSEEHTSELQSLLRIPSAVFCLKKTKKQHELKN